MSGPSDSPVEREGLAFFGTVVASVTHEMNNILSIIDQVGGLLGDLTVKAAAGAAVDPHRLETLRGRIDRQVRKGIGIVHHLNRFAHSLDDPHRPFDTSETLEDVLALSERFADLKKVRLICAAWADWPAVGDAFLFQRAVHEALRRILAESTEGDRIEVDSRRDGETGVVSISGSAKSSMRKDDDGFQRVAGLMCAMGGECRMRTSEQGGTVLELHLSASFDEEVSREGD